MTSRRSSLRSRLLVVIAVMLMAAFGVTAAVLDMIFRASAETALVNQLDVQVLALVGAVEADDTGNLTVPRRFLDARLENPGSGLYAEVLDGAGLPLWRSPSAVGLDLASGATLGAGERIIRRRRLTDGSNALLLGVGINWELGPSATPAFQVFVASDLTGYEDQLRQFRRQLAGWFSVVMLALMAALWLAIRRGLSPLRRMAGEVAAVEGGDRETLSEDYPRELDGVARGLNTLINSERQRMARYRTTMDDLAHSLKTPLAVLRTELDGGSADGPTLRTQVDRMQAVVDYQLRRAAAAGPRSLAARPVPLEPIVRDVMASLNKIHRDRAVECQLDIPAGASFPAEQGDLYEILGNLLDNAWKWCAGQVRVRVRAGAMAGGRNGAATMLISVADDGPGVPEGDEEAVFDRGMRADQRGDVPGQGIGLAVVREIVALYGGSVRIGRGDPGGAVVEVSLPLPGAPDT